MLEGGGCTLLCGCSHLVQICSLVPSWFVAFSVFYSMKQFSFSFSLFPCVYVYVCCGYICICVFCVCGGTYMTVHVHMYADVSGDL